MVLYFCLKREGSLCIDTTFLQLRSFREGNLVDAKMLEKGFKSGKFVKLRDCFRMPRAMIDHIDSEKVLPTSDLPTAKDVESRGVLEESMEKNIFT